MKKKINGTVEKNVIAAKQIESKHEQKPNTKSSANFKNDKPSWNALVNSNSPLMIDKEMIDPDNFCNAVETKTSQKKKLKTPNIQIIIARNKIKNKL